MATASHYRSTFTGVTDDNYVANWTLSPDLTDTGTVNSIGTYESAVGTQWEINVLERTSASVGSGPVYSESGSAANKISSADSKLIANTLAAAFKKYLVDNYTTTKVHKITATIELKG